MAETGGDGFQIAKGFVSVEARVNEASVTRARQQVAGAPGAAGAAQPPAQPQQPAQQPQGGALGIRLADARASLADTGTQAARTLEQGFRQGLNSLSNMAVQQLRSLQSVPAAPPVTPVVAQPQVQAGISNAQVVQMSGQIVAAVSARLGPQVAQQVGQMIRQQTITQPAQQLRQAPTTAPRSQAANGSVVNNYRTTVRIEPRFVRQLLEVIRDINQLKSRNRATR